MQMHQMSTGACPAFVSPCFYSAERTRSWSLKKLASHCTRRPRGRSQWRVMPLCCDPSAKDNSRGREADKYGYDSVSGGGFALAELPMMVLDAAPEIPGAYAVRDAEGTLCYIGYSKNILKKLRFHLDAVGPERAACCQIYAPRSDKISADLLEAVLEYWVRENGGVVPSGNMTERGMWEGPASRDVMSSAGFASAESRHEHDVRHKTDENERRADSSIPYRARQTAKRVVDMRSPGFKMPGFNSNKSESETSDNDYVKVDVDPLDPFSPGRKRNSSQWSSVPVGEDMSTSDDWLPLIALVGIATFMWVCSVLGNALPSASPTLGM